jgi:hypothetical protein
MTPLLWLVLLPCLYWTAGPESAPALKAAGIDRVCVPAQEVERWQGVGVTVTPLTAEAIGARQTLLPPGIVPRAGVASPTRAPWVQHNGWRFRREAGVKYVYEAAEGRGVLAVAEAAMYGVDAVVTLAPADLPQAGQVLAFLSQVPVLDLPDIAASATARTPRPSAAS